MLRHAAFVTVARSNEERSMKRERLTFEMEAEIKTSLESWAREEDRSIGSLLRRLVEQSVRERRGEHAGGDTGARAA